MFINQKNRLGIYLIWFSYSMIIYVRYHFYLIKSMVQFIYTDNYLFVYPTLDNFIDLFAYYLIHP